ncbi:MAG: DUF4159 domain-containing protein, partial [Planctomycetota bacterium]|nr:DUF4159 domain-containing protein [Planctomycetota bacterium]
MCPRYRHWASLVIILATVWTLVQPAAAEDLTSEKVRKAIEKGVAFLKRKQNPNGGWDDAVPMFPSMPKGVTSLCTLALLNAGVPHDDECIQRAMKLLREQKPSQTYSAALNTMVLCIVDPTKDAALIARNVRFLEKIQIKGGPRKGAWSYTSADINSGDNSNAQFAVLALYEAQRVGVKVDPAAWNMAYQYWTKSQNQDDSWGYQRSGPDNDSGPGTGSMTCAGLASLLICQSQINDGDASIEGEEVQCCGAKLPHEKVEGALKWIGKTFTVHDNPSLVANAGRGWHLYYLYGIERVGRLSGQRFLVGGDGEKRDWYREGTEKLLTMQKSNGEFQGKQAVEEKPEIGTSLALLFISKGRRPVVIGKLQHGKGNDWNRHRADVANLTTYVEGKWKKDFPIGLSWQVVDSKLATVEDLLQSPVLLINGSTTLDISEEEIKRLRDYLDRGGLIVAEACCENSRQFDVSFRALMEKVFADRPEHRLKLLTADHPVWYAEERVAPDQQRPLLGIDYGCRTSVIYAPPPRDGVDPPGNLSCYWELDSGSLRKRSDKIQQQIDG